MGHRFAPMGKSHEFYFYLIGAISVYRWLILLSVLSVSPWWILHFPERLKCPTN
jgi:hypothetical protein